MKTSLFSQIYAYIDNSIHFFFPIHCIGCKTPKTYVCEQCLLRIEKPHQNLPTWVHALFSYKNKLIRRSIWLLKYKGIYGVAKIYGPYLYENIIEDHAEKLTTTSILLVPIPLGPSRMRERGYNQSLLIAKAILACDNNSFMKLETTVLKRNDGGIRQSHIKKRQIRLTNTTGNFYIANPEKITGAHVVIVDDVVTTGATLKEARKILLEAGAKKVSAYTIGH